MAQPIRRSVRIGSNLQVSPVCLGVVDDPNAVLTAWDAGINFFFVSADMHWPTYKHLRRGLRLLAKERPASLDEAVIAGCSYVAQPEFSAEPFRELLEALAPFRKLDILTVGGSYAVDVNDRVEMARRRIDQGLVGATCVASTVHDRPAAPTLVNSGSVELAFIRFNARHPGALVDVFPHLKADRRCRLFGFGSTYGSLTPEQLKATLDLDEALWLPTITDHYRLAFAQPALDGILCAPRTCSEVEALVEAYAQGPLEPFEVSHLLELGRLVNEKDTSHVG